MAFLFLRPRFLFFYKPEIAAIGGNSLTANGRGHHKNPL
jgi:hypothetical protein